MQAALQSNRERLLLISGVGLALVVTFLCILVPMTYRWFRGLLTVTDPYLK